MNIGTKVRIKNCLQTEFQGQIGVVEGIAPDLSDTTIYKVRVSEMMIIPGWFKQEDLEMLES